MFKKILVFLLCGTLLLCASGCSYSVASPMSYPDYTFDSEPDTMTLRMTAVQAMRDILSIQWCTETEITYRKTGPVSQKQFVHEPRKTYAGLLYSSANTGIFQFLEYYNMETGMLEYPGDSEALKKELGSSCADALLWAWSTVCNSISGGFYPVLMVPNNGYQPVGKYTYNLTVFSYNEMPSYTIIENNPKETIMESYAQILPADALVSTSDNHAMMAIESACVVYLQDGTIDSANSYVMIQDQRAGGSTFYEHKENGHTLYYSGRTSAKYTFDELYEEDYIPVTTQEFLGTKPYDKAEVIVTGVMPESVADLQNACIEANYPLAVINLITIDAEGNESIVDRTVFGGAAMQGAPRSYLLNEMDRSSTIEDGIYVKVEVVVSTGERFVPIEFTA